MDTDAQSFLSSFSFHVIILLAASFMVGVEPPKDHIILNLNFGSDTVESIDIDSKFQEFEQELAAEPDTSEPLSHQVVAIEEDVSVNNLEYVSLDNTDRSPLIETLPPIETNLQESFAEETAKAVVETRQITDNPDVSIIQQIAGSITAGQSTSISAPTTIQSGGQSSLDQRLSAAGAKTGDVQVSMSWNTIDDIDLYIMFSPGNGLADNINWMNRLGKLSSGMLDIDMNANSAFLSNQPVENIFWPPNSSPSGHFVVYVHFYRSWTGNKRVPVLVRIKQRDSITEHQIVALIYSSPQEVTRFNFLGHQK